MLAPCSSPPSREGRLRIGRSPRGPALSPRRDILKEITHGLTADDIVSLCTAFPWPTLCGEVQKLVIELSARNATREPPLVVVAEELQGPTIPLNFRADARV